MTKSKIQINQKIKKSVEILRNGGVIIFPTETVYGIGCAYDNQEAIDRIYKIKNRPKDKPLQILIADKKQLEDLTTDIPKEAQEMIDKEWPGPITLILKVKNKNENKTIGIRMPDHPIALQIIKELGKPMAATSANLSGEPAPITIEQVRIKADLIIDGGKTEQGIASSVIDFTINPPKIIRKGIVST